MFQVFEEPVAAWQNFYGINLLCASYENPLRDGFAFQSYILLTLLKEHFEQPTAKYKLMEGSILSARNCFVKRMQQKNSIIPTAFEVLHEWSKFVEEKLLVTPDVQTEIA